MYSISLQILWKNEKHLKWVFVYHLIIMMEENKNCCKLSCYLQLERYQCLDIFPVKWPHFKYLLTNLFILLTYLIRSRGPVVGHVFQDHEILGSNPGHCLLP